MHAVSQSEAPPTVMLIGLGELGRRVLQMFALHTTPGTIVAGARTFDSVVRVVNTTRAAAVQLEIYREIRAAHIDLSRPREVASVIEEFKPDVIVNMATHQSWWVVQELPASAREVLAPAEMGPWLPMHLALAFELMNAIALTGQSPVVINAAYPDVVNVSLTRAGMPVAAGFGNVANPVPALRMAAAATLRAPIASVEVRLVAGRFVSHRLTRTGDAGGAPFILRVLEAGKDVTAKLDLQALLAELPTTFRRLGGRVGQTVTASSATSVLDALLLNDQRVLHAPGPAGLSGGYPVFFRDRQPHIDLPADVSLAEAVATNEATLRLDGIDRVDENGRVYFSDSHMSVLKSVLGYEVASVTPEESIACATELTERFQHFAAKWN